MKKENKKPEEGELGFVKTTVANKTKRGFDQVIETIVDFIKVPLFQSKKIKTPLQYWDKPVIKRKVIYHKTY